MDVIVIGNDHYNTYGIIRSLGEKNIFCDAVIMNCNRRNSYVLRSKYIRNGYSCWSFEEVLTILKGYDGTNNLIICCSDEAEEFVVSHYQVLSKNFILPLCENPEDTIRLMNKDFIGELARHYGITTPATWQVIDHHIPEGVTYPCITKPITSTSGHKSDIVVCRNKKELSEVVENKARCTDFVVQQYIEFEMEVSILGVVLADGEVVLSGCIDKLRTCMIGTTSFGVMVDNSFLGENVPKLIAMMKSTGYRGLFSAEFIIKEGVYYFLEVNFRSDGNIYVPTATGQNLPLLYWQSFNKGLGKVLSYNAYYPCYFMLDIEDFFALRKNNVSIRQWRKDLKRANVCLVYNKQDVQPFKKKVRSNISSLSQRIWHKVIG